MATASSPAALENKLKPVVVINKIDRENARPHKVMDEIFDPRLPDAKEDL